MKPRKSPDRSADVLECLKVGPARFSQLMTELRLHPEDLRALDYDLRKLRKAGKIVSLHGLWRLSPPPTTK